MDEKKYLNTDGLIRLVANLINKFADRIHSHTLSEISDYVVDSELSSTSTNPVENNVINAKFDSVDANIANTILKVPQELTDEEVDQVHKNLQLENLPTKEEVEALFQKLNSDMALRFYCVEDVAVIINGVSTTYPANSNVEIKFVEGDVFEIVPTSDNSIMALNAFPGALATYYSWLEGVKQFSNILFDMNDVEMYSKWSQGNQGAYQVQYAQYTNCIFWSDNSYVSDVSKRTNYTLYYTSQLPLCYSSIPDNTFKAFYLAFNANSDPNWGNKAYRDSFAKATWATQVFSYYGARTIGIFGHDDPDFNITLPKDCRGLMYQSTAIENAGTFDAINTTNFGAKSGSWRDAFGQCSSLRNLYIKNLKVNLNVSWSPINYESISFIISEAANTSAITIYVSPYTYNLLGQSDFDLAAEKNITIALLDGNYVEDKRLSNIDNKADRTYVDEKISELVDSAPETMNTLGKLATAFQENDDVVQVLNEAITTKADKAYVDEMIDNIPTESDVVIIDCPDGSTISHTFEQIMTAVNSDKVVYASIYGLIIAPLTYVADDGSFVEFNAVKYDGQGEAETNSLIVNSDNSFRIVSIDLLSRQHDEIQGPNGEKDIVDVINYLVEKSNELDEIKANKSDLDAYLKIEDYIPGSGSTESTEEGSSVTTEYVYTYDGDNTSDAHDWITNYGNLRMFVRMGDIPKGELNLVGATLFRTNPSNAWLDRTVEVTEEMLNKTIIKADTDMPATQPGLIQIFDQNSSDFSEFTIACICTVPGWYNVTFDDWFEAIYFGETGIYGYDKRAYGGNDYLKSFTFSVTTSQSGSVDDSVSSPVKYEGNEIQMFARGICIGDSVTEGSFDNAQGGAIIKKFSYPSILQRITNVDIVNAGIAGMTSKTWYESSLDSTSQWGTWVNNEWVWHTAPEVGATDVSSTELDYSGYDFAIIHLGINDIGLIEADTTIEEMLVDFESNIGNIISKLKASNNGIKIFLATIIPSYAYPGNDAYANMNNKIKEIAEANSDVYLLDLNKYSECASQTAYNKTHPTAIGYHKIADEIASYISYIISTNLDDFSMVQFIGTEYTV